MNRINATITDKQLLMLNALMDQGGHISISETIRSAIGYAYEKKLYNKYGKQGPSSAISPGVDVLDPNAKPEKTEQEYCELVFGKVINSRCHWAVGETERPLPEDLDAQVKVIGYSKYTTDLKYMKDHHSNFENKEGDFFKLSMDGKNRRLQPLSAEELKRGWVTQRDMIDSDRELRSR